MHFAEGVERRLRERFDLRGIGHVRRHADCLGAAGAQCVDGLRKRLRIHVGKHKLHAQRRALLRERPAETARRPGDHRHLACKFKHRFSPGFAGLVLSAQVYPLGSIGRRPSARVKRARSTAAALRSA
jgi:hypothetical protein